MVDLSKLEVGQTVKFVCGGQAEVKEIEESPIIRINLVFIEEPDHHYNYMLDGSLTGAYGPRIFDIIEVIPKPFGWDTVRTGMAFTHTHGKRAIYFYVGWNPHDLHAKEICITKKCNADGKYEYMQSAISYLTRAPEHDIKVLS